MNKKICSLCGEEIDTDDCELDRDADGFLILCPNECILFSVRFDMLGDLKEQRDD